MNGMMFLKRLSDSFDEEQERITQYYIDNGKSEEDAQSLAQDSEEYVDTFYVPTKAHWSHIKDLHNDIGAELNKATELIEETNPTIEGVLTTIDFNIKDKLNDKVLRDMISHYGKYRL